MAFKNKISLLVFTKLLSAGYVQLSASAMASTVASENGAADSFTAQLLQQQVEDIVRRSYQYVAMCRQEV
jgi:hypothetical protein